MKRVISFIFIFLLAGACSSLEGDSLLSIETRENEPYAEDPVPQHLGIDSNLPPTANAGTDKSGQDGDRSGSERIFLDGSASSDPDGFILSYEWFENSVLLATGVNPSVDFAVGVHTVTLVVTDDQGAFGEDIVTITVTQPILNQAPFANAKENLSVEDKDLNGYEVVTLDGSGSHDPDGEIVSYRWLEEGTTLYTGPSPFTEVFFLVGSHNLTLRVTDDKGATDEITLLLRVTVP